MDHQIEPVEERTRNPGGVARSRPGAAPTVDAPALAAGTRVHRRDEQHPGGVFSGPTGARDAHHTFLQWLAKGIEHARGELTQLVEEEHALARHADFAGSGMTAPTTHERGHGGGVVRGPERGSQHEARRREGQSGRAVDPGHGAGRIRTEIGQEPDESTGEHGLARPRRSDEQEMMTSGRGDGQRVAGRLLAPHVGEIGTGVGGHGHDGRVDVGPRQPFGQGTHGLAQPADGPGPLAEAQHRHVGIGPRDDHPPLGQDVDQWKDALYRADAAVETELADGRDIAEQLERNLPGRPQDAECNRKVEARADLSQPARGEIDGDPSQRPFETARLDRGADAIARFATRRIRQTHDREPGEPIGDVDLDGDSSAVEPFEGG